MNDYPIVIEQPAAFVGAILTGGSSTRMGRDKALLPIDGVPMAARVAHAMRAAGAADVIAIGGDAAGLTAAGLHVVPDRYPGEGPLGAIATALRAASPHPVVVAPCDLIAPDPAAMVALVDHSRDDHQVDVSVAAARGADGVLEINYVFGWWHPRTVAVVEDVLQTDARSVRAALDRLAVATVQVSETALLDADAPGDLPGGTSESR